MVTRRIHWTVVSALAVVGLLASGLLVWRASEAAFSATTSNPSNSWQSGAVSLTDDDTGSTPTTGSAMFSLTKLKGGQTGSRCITVTYGGDLAAAVKLYATSASGALAAYLDLTVEEGDGGGFADCTGFNAATATTLFSGGTLADFTAGKTSFGNGVGGWAPSGNATEKKTYRFTWTVRSDNGAQNQTSQATFVWESRST